MEPSRTVPGAWDISSGSPEVIVAVIDTGFQLDHPALKDQWTDFKYDYVTDDTTHPLMIRLAKTPPTVPM